jgi:hypothetical protein
MAPMTDERHSAGHIAHFEGHGCDAETLAGAAQRHPELDLQPRRAAAETEP